MNPTTVETSLIQRQTSKQQSSPPQLQLQQAMLQPQQQPHQLSKFDSMHKLLNQLLLVVAVICAIAYVTSRMK
jgi:hypothetical protein